MACSSNVNTPDQEPEASGKARKILAAELGVEMSSITLIGETNDGGYIDVDITEKVKQVVYAKIHKTWRDRSGNKTCVWMVRTQ